MKKSEQIIDLLPSTVSLSSNKAGWRSLHLRDVIQPPRLELFHPPVVEDLLMFLGRQGETTLERLEDGKWRRVRVKPGHLSLTAPGDGHQLRWYGYGPRLSTAVILPAATLNAARQDLHDDDYKVKAVRSNLSVTDTVITSTIVSIRKALLDRLPNLYAETAAHFLAIHCLTNHAVSYRRMKQGGETMRMKLLDEYLRANLARPVSLEELARVSSVTRFRLMRLCKRYWGESPFQRLQRLRLETGRSLLRKTNLSVIAVSQECGYDNPSHFATAFRRSTGNHQLATAPLPSICNQTKAPDRMKCNIVLGG